MHTTLPNGTICNSVMYTRMFGCPRLVLKHWHVEMHCVIVTHFDVGTLSRSSLWYSTLRFICRQDWTQLRDKLPASPFTVAAHVVHELPGIHAYTQAASKSTWLSQAEQPQGHQRLAPQVATDGCCRASPATSMWAVIWFVAASTLCYVTE